MKFIKQFHELTLADTPLVGGKNASLGQMISKLSSKYVVIPHGFAITADAYWYYLENNAFLEKIKHSMAQLTDYHDIPQLQKVGHEIRTLIISGTIPDDLKTEIADSYKYLSRQYGDKDSDVAVRSSATAEDLPTASFAGQQETYLNIHGLEQLYNACKKCMASLFTDRAIVYRYQKGFVLGDMQQTSDAVGSQGGFAHWITLVLHKTASGEHYYIIADSMNGRRLESNNIKKVITAIEGENTFKTP